MGVSKQEGTIELWAAGDYVPHWVYKCDKGHQEEIPVAPGTREAYHERRLEKLEQGICPYCEAN